MFIHTKLQKQSQSLDGLSGKETKEDKFRLDDNEVLTLKIASTFGLIDKPTREKYYKEALEGTLTEFQIEQIKKVQEGLKVDGKYHGDKDGKFGPESTQALKELILENDSALQAIEVLKSYDIKQNFSEITNNPNSSNERKNSNRCME